MASKEIGLELNA